MVVVAAVALVVVCNREEVNVVVAVEAHEEVVCREEIVTIPNGHTPTPAEGKVAGKDITTTTMTNPTNPLRPSQFQVYGPPFGE